MKQIFDNEFRNNAVQYIQEHEILSIKNAANLGIGKKYIG